MYSKCVVFLTIIYLVTEPGDSSILNKNVSQSKCKEICAASGHPADFHRIKKMCKCLPTQKIYEKRNAINKREVSLTEAPLEQVLVQTTLAPPTTESVRNPEGLVGQAAPSRRPLRPTAARRGAAREPRTITIEQQHATVQQINDHLNRLDHLYELRGRQLEIEAIKANLRQLSNTVLSNQQRARTRRPGRGRGPNRIVGAVHNEEKHFEIITQDPSLIDE